MQLAEIRRREGIAALSELGHPATTTLTSATMTFAGNLRIARRCRESCSLDSQAAPDVLFAGIQAELSTLAQVDHRAAAYLAADAARAAMWRLLFGDRSLKSFFGLKDT